jgi:2Fe-2S ferredoxin
MPRITVVPHDSLCPEGAEFHAEPGSVLCRELLVHGIAIEHACELSCACTTCHVLVRKGFDSLDPSDEQEDDMLDKAWGLGPQSRLSCQVQLKSTDLTIEIPRYTINHAREDH